MRSDDTPGEGIPQVLVGVSFDSLFRAQEFLLAVRGLAAEERLKLNDAVTVVKNEAGHTTVHETVDLAPGPAAMSGAFWAGLFGLMLGGPVGWIAGIAVGAGAGAVTAKVVDLGISDEWVGWFRAAVKPGAAIMALLVEKLDEDALVAEVARFPGAELVYANLGEETLSRLRDALHPPVSSEPS
jgi:uncharacterized membrane protein